MDFLWDHQFLYYPIPALLINPFHRGVFAVEKSLLNGTFFHIMETNQFLENDRKFFRLTAPVCISAPKVRMDKEQVAEVARLPEKTAENISKEFEPGPLGVREEKKFQLLKEG